MLAMAKGKKKKKMFSMVHLFISKMPWQRITLAF